MLFVFFSKAPEHVECSGIYYYKKKVPHIKENGDKPYKYTPTCQSQHFIVVACAILQRYPMDAASCRMIHTQPLAIAKKN
jgi:hypothetical protein